MADNADTSGQNYLDQIPAEQFASSLDPYAGSEGPSLQSEIDRSPAGKLAKKVKETIPKYVNEKGASVNPKDPFLGRDPIQSEIIDIDSPAFQKAQQESYDNEYNAIRDTGKANLSAFDDWRKVKEDFSAATGYKSDEIDLEKKFGEIDVLADAQKNQKLLESALLKAKAKENMQGLQAQTNLRPMAQLVDAWTGSNFSSFYATPKYFDEKLAEAKDITSAATKAEEDAKNLALTNAKWKLMEAIKFQNAKSNADMKAIALQLQNKGLNIKNKAIDVNASMERLKAMKPEKKHAVQAGGMKELTLTKNLNDSMENFKQYLINNPDLIGAKNQWFKIATNVAGADLAAKRLLGREAVAWGMMNAINQNLGKKMEGGVLREYDEKVKYPNILATLTETPEIFLAKFNNTHDLVRNDWRNTVKIMDQLNYDTGTLPKEIGPTNEGPIAKRVSTAPNPPPKKASGKAAIDANSYMQMTPAQKAEYIKKLKTGKK